jgi:hypothetical protein
MSRVSLSDYIVKREEPSIKEQVELGLSKAQLTNYKKGLGAVEGQLISLLENSMQNAKNFTKEQEDTKKLIQEEEAANRFRERFTEKDYDEEKDYYAKQAGLDSKGSIFFTEDDKVDTGYMGYFEASDAGSMYGGNFELMSTNKAALRRKTQMLGSDALLKTSKAWSKIQSDMGMTSDDKIYYDRQIKNSNNWEAWTNINDAESLAQTVPIVDPIFTALADQTPEEVLLKRKDPTFNGQKIVDAMKEEDPEFIAFLKSEGVSIDLLASAVNPFHFRYIINSSVQGNAIARSLTASEKYNTTAANWAMFGLEQARASLTSGDFVGQVALTAATAGLGAAIAGTATATNMLTATSRANAAIRTSKVASDLAKAGQVVTNIKNYLPANIPSTVLRKLAPEGIVKGKNMWATGGSWLTGQMIEGFVEEGLTDVWNQVYELNEGVRLTYDFNQTWQASYMGAFMEPVLGAALTGVTIPVTITTSLAGKVGTDFAGSLFSGTFNIDKSRFKEMNLYFDSFMGKFDEMSPEDRQVRIGTITAALVTEAAMNEATNNTYGKTESNVNFIGRIFQILQEDQIIDKSNIAMLSLSGLAVRLNNLRQDLNKTFRVREVNGQKVLQNQDASWEVPYTEEIQSIFSINDRNEVFFTKEGAELFMAAMIADSQGNSETRESNIVDIVLFMAREKLEKKIKDSNPDKTEDEIQELVESEVSKEGESEFTKIRDALAMGFEIVGNLNRNQVKEESKLEAPSPEKETAEELVKSIQQLREEHAAELMEESSTPEAMKGIPTLLERPEEVKETEITGIPPLLERPEGEEKPVTTTPEIKVEPETKPKESSPIVKEIESTMSLEEDIKLLPLDLRLALKNIKNC